MPLLVCMGNRARSPCQRRGGVDGGGPATRDTQGWGAPPEQQGLQSAHNPSLAGYSGL